MSTPSEYELAFRRKLQKHISELRESLLDVLAMVRSSDDPIPASLDVFGPEPDALRARARQIEHRDRKIKRAREVIDGTKGSDTEAGVI